MLKQRIDSKKSSFFAAILVAMSHLALALPGDREQAIQVDADSAERNEKTGVTSYIGSVELNQGSLNILADRIDIYTINGEVDHAIAIGERAYLTQQQSIGKPPVKAWALTIRYSLNSEIVNLLGDARIEQDGSIVNSPEIDYYADQELVKAKGGKQGSNDRVRVTLPPKNQADNTEIEAKSTRSVALDSVALDKEETTKNDDTTAISKPLIEAIKPLEVEPIKVEPINVDSLEQVKIAPTDSTETPQ
jgi:lipopolysaccharide export system protein LptA